MPVRRLDALRLLGAASYAALAGCVPSEQRGVLRVGMVTDVGGLGDRSFNDSAYRGLVRAHGELGLYTTVLQSFSAADYQSNMIVLANKEYAMIFAIGFLMAEDVGEVAARYPDRHLTIVDAVVDAPNVTSLTFKEQEGSFLAGALAARVTKTKKIAFLGGMDIPLLRKFEAGFIAGAREIDPSIAVAVKYVGSFEDVAAGKELGEVLYDGGNDIIYAAAGKCGLGTIEAAKARRGDYVIGVDSDQDALAPGYILTSVVKRVDVGVFDVCQDVAAHRPTPRRIILGLRENGVSLTDFRYTRAIVTAPIRAELDRLREMIIAGRIVVPYTREQLATWKPVPF